MPPERTETANVSIQDVVGIQQTTFLQRLFASQPFWITVALVAIIVFMGVYPKPFLDRIAPSVERLVDHVEENSDHREPKVSSQGEDVVPASERRSEGEGHGGEGDGSHGGADDHGSGAAEGEGH